MLRGFKSRYVYAIERFLVNNVSELNDLEINIWRLNQAYNTLIDSRTTRLSFTMFDFNIIPIDYYM